ncbi:MAG TPA: hypothetical protein VI391_07480, partial [Thermoanaerobaculia bacterium]
MTQTGANVSGTFNSDVSEQNLFGGCSANGGPVTISFTGTISGNTVTVNASGITGTVTVTGNTLAGSLSGFGDTITVAMTKQGSASSGACNLGMTLNCNGANCSATTINNGSNVCSGQYIVGFVIDDPQNRGTVTNFATTLPLSNQECFDNGSIAFGLGLGACVGDASLNPGGSFTMNGTVNFAGADPSSLLAVTLVLDPTSGETIAESYVINGAPPAATCTPVASVPSVTQSGNSYTVSWTAVTEPNATYTVEESTSSDFSTITNTKQTNSLSQTFTNSPGTTTRYFYRVRANVCSGAPGTNSLP